EARSSDQPIRKEGFRFQPKEGSPRDLSLEVAPIRVNGTSNLHFLILFEESATSTQDASPSVSPPVTPKQRREKESSRVGNLKQELTTARAHLQATVEESEATTE